MNLGEHIRSLANKAAGISSNLLKSTVNREPELMKSLLTSHIRPVLEFCSVVWHTGYVGDTDMLERVQRRWTKDIVGLSHLDYASRLDALGLFCAWQTA